MRSIYQEWKYKLEPITILNKVRNLESNSIRLSVYLPLSELKGKSKSQMTINAVCFEAEQLLTTVLNEDMAGLYLEKLKNTLKDYYFTEEDLGIAVFISRDQVLSCMLPIEPQRLVVAASSYHLKPLLHAAYLDNSCLVVNLTTSQLEVYKVNHNEVKLLRTYKNQLMNRDKGSQRLFVGEHLRKKNQTLEFIQSCAKDMIKTKLVKDKKLIILGAPVWRKRLESELKNNTDFIIIHRGERLRRLDKLKALARKLLLNHQKNLSLRKLLKQEVDSDIRLTTELHEIARAAIAGRIDKLYVQAGVQKWGVFNRLNGRVTTHKKQKNAYDDCVVDDIAEEVLKFGGKVLFFESTHSESPTEDVAAKLRW